METIFGTPGHATIFAYLFFFASLLVGCSGSIWVKKHAKCTQDIYNSANSFNLMLVSFETIFFLVASIVASIVRNTGAPFVWDTPTIVCAAIRAVAYVLGMLGYLMAVRHGPLLLTTIICRAGLAIPILLSAVIWPDSNKVRWYMAIGMALLFLALFLFNKKEGNGQPLSKTTPAFWFWAITGAVGNGMEGFSVKLLENWTRGSSASGASSLENCLFYASILQVIVFAIVLFRYPPQKTGIDEDGVALPGKGRPSFKEFLPVSLIGCGWIVCYAITNATSFYTSSLTIAYLPVVFYFMANTGFSILFSFIIARFIFREKLRPMQYVGCVIAVIGLILLNDWASVLA